jgi:Effector Associated Constant Component 1
MEGDAMEENVQFVEVEALDEIFAEGTTGWEQDREELVATLRRELDPGAIVVDRPKPDDKGDKGFGLEAIILALGSAGAFQAAARCFATWIRHRPGRRRIRVKAKVGDKNIVVELDADNVGQDALKPVWEGIGGTLSS